MRVPKVQMAAQRRKPMTLWMILNKRFILLFSRDRMIWMETCLSFDRSHAVPRKVIQSMAYSLNWFVQTGVGRLNDRVKMEAHMEKVIKRKRRAAGTARTAHIRSKSLPMVLPLFTLYDGATPGLAAPGSFAGASLQCLFRDDSMIISS